MSEPTLKMTSEARNGDSLHCLVRLHNALVGARCSMDHPRMDAHKQTGEALQSVLMAFDRETEREMRIAVQAHIEMSEYCKNCKKGARGE